MQTYSHDEANSRRSSLFCEAPKNWSSVITMQSIQFQENLLDFLGRLYEYICNKKRVAVRGEMNFSRFSSAPLEKIAFGFWTLFTKNEKVLEAEVNQERLRGITTSYPKDALIFKTAY